MAGIIRGTDSRLALENFWRARVAMAGAGFQVARARAVRLLRECQNGERSREREQAEAEAITAREEYEAALQVFSELILRGDKSFKKG